MGTRMELHKRLDLRGTFGVRRLEPQRIEGFMESEEWKN